jgi:hypothetical protein
MRAHLLRFDVLRRGRLQQRRVHPGGLLRRDLPYWPELRQRRLLALKLPERGVPLGRRLLLDQPMHLRGLRWSLLPCRLSVRGRGRGLPTDVLRIDAVCER